MTIPKKSNKVLDGPKASKHWNLHQLCAIDLETTGTDPDKHDIIQICILPLESNLEPSSKLHPFFYDMLFLKNRDDWDPEAMRAHKIDMDKLEREALDPYIVGDRLEEWFNTMNLPFGKKILPLAHNWPFEYKFLLKWLGEKTVNHLFWQYRDTMVLANAVMDMADFNNEPYPYPKVGLGYICTTLGISHERQHDALGDCLATAKLYKKLCLGHNFYV